MRTIRLLDLGSVSPLRSQTVYHAAAYAMREETPDTVILVSPGTPYVCIGLHQDPEKEVDLDFCRSRKLDVIRREVGGGAVFLDNDQLFVQWIFHKKNLPASIESCFRLYIRPIVETYRELGVNASMRPVNDIHVDGKKIGGTGAAEIEAATVVVGSIMFRFDKQTMSRVLKVPSEKMRDKVYQSLETYMTTLEEQLGRAPDRERVKEIYLQECSRALGAHIRPGKWSTQEEKVAAELDGKFASSEWLSQKTGRLQTGVKIHEDVTVHQSDFKTPGGLVRVIARLRAGRIDEIAISGDFTLLPARALNAIETELRGITPTPEALRNRLEDVYRKNGIRSPGLSPAHLAEAISAAVQ
jgi:lipoate-protein ligase A